MAVRQSVISASTGRPGPSVLDLGFQVLVSPTACVAEPLELPEPPAASQKSIDRAMEIITSAQNPVLFVGAGVQLSQATAELRLFAEALGIPIVPPRSEERRVGKESVSQCRVRWWPDNEKKKKKSTKHAKKT